MRPSSTVLSYKLPPVEPETPVRSNLYGLITKAPNRFVVLRQSLTTAVLPDVRMPIVMIIHNFKTKSFHDCNMQSSVDLTTFLDLYSNFH